MRKAHGVPIWVLLSLVLLPVDLQAGQWGLGVGVASQRQALGDTASQAFVLPFPSYQGERLNLDFGSVSYALSKSRRFQFALEGQLRFDGYDPAESPALAGLEERDLTFDAGFSLTTSHPWGTASLKVVSDVLGVHKGFEINTSYQYAAQFGRWTLAPTIGVSLVSDDLVDYYYGVKVAEAIPGRPAYFGDTAINVSAGLNGVYALGGNWDLIGGAEYIRLGSEITNSPIITRDYQVVTYSAVVYRF